ncbi:MAG TPA: hypothetical protein VLN59_09565 [Burkholderiales bacterium]|nr:hypothetical protein [Burkholderiales bacterium]
MPKQTAPAASEPFHAHAERHEVIERPVPTQPVAYTGGRYVYGYAPSVEQSADVRRSPVRHRGTRAATNIR